MLTDVEEKERNLSDKILEMRKVAEDKKSKDTKKVNQDRLEGVVQYIDQISPELKKLNEMTKTAKASADIKADIFEKAPKAPITQQKAESSPLTEVELLKGKGKQKVSVQQEEEEEEGPDFRVMPTSQFTKLPEAFDDVITAILPKYHSTTATQKEKDDIKQELADNARDYLKNFVIYDNKTFSVKDSKGKAKADVFELKYLIPLVDTLAEKNVFDDLDGAELNKINKQLALSKSRISIPTKQFGTGLKSMKKRNVKKQSGGALGPKVDSSPIAKELFEKSMELAEGGDPVLAITVLEAIPTDSYTRADYLKVYNYLLSFM